LSVVFIALVALLGSMLPVHGAESETFTGTAARTGTYKRPLLQVAGKRYELKASDKADASVADMLAKFSTGDTGTYAVTGARATVNGKDGIIVDRIAPAAKPPPSTGAAAPATQAVQSNMPPAPANTNATVTSRVVTVSSRKYRVYYYTVPASRSFSLVIPEGLKTVRGLLVVANHAGGDSRDYWTDCTYYREFMPLHGFAFVGAVGYAGSHPADLQALRNCQQMVATASRHPELVNAPYAAAGFSAGGGFASQLMTLAPDRTIAAGLYGTRYNFKEFFPPNPPPSDAFLDIVLGIPAVLITGEQEHFNAPNPQTGVCMIDEVFMPYRPRGALYAWLERQGIGHAYDENRQDLVAMPLLDAAVRARYPKDGDVTKGPIKLLPIDPSSGWVADNTTWKSGLTKIYPARQFKGDLGHSSWLLNEDIAFIYRAYATWDKPLTITSPGNCWPTVPPLDPGASAPIIVDASRFPNWKTMAFYDGAKKLAEIKQAPAQFIATNLTPGYHVFSVLATDADGTVGTADPKMVVVRNP
jgi:hypothetical protein